MQDVAIGIDIGGTFTKFGIVDKEGNLFYENSIASDKHEDPIDFIKELHSILIPEIEKNSDKYTLKGIGIGAPNGNYYTGNIDFAPNLIWKGKIKLAEICEKVFGYPTIVTNDANAAALGEMLFGGAKGMSNFVVVTLGTGLGSGIVVNGGLVYGHDGFAGELGHVCAVDNGRQCGCGKRGCLETYVSATGITRTVFELLANENDDSCFRDVSFNDIKSKDVYTAAINGDPIAIKAFEKTGYILGKNLADTVAHISPQAFFLFGGLAGAGKLILDPTKKAMEENLVKIYQDKIDILLSGLLDKNIAVLGSAALVLQA